MMLWFAFLLLLFRAPDSDARLLPQEQVRVATGLCDGEADSLFSSAAALFVSSRSLHPESILLPSEINDLNVENVKENGVVFETELLNQRAQIHSGPSTGDHLKVEIGKLKRAPPASMTASELQSSLASTPSTGGHLVVESNKKNRAPPASMTDSELLLNNLASTPSPSNNLVVETNKKNGAPPASMTASELQSRLDSTPSSGGHLVVESNKKNRAPPSITETGLLTKLSVSVPSGGNHLTVEKKTRSPPSLTSDSEILNNLGKRRPVTPSRPSGGDHLTVEKRQRSPPADFQTLVSEPTKDSHGGNHLTVQAKHKRSPPGFGDSEILAILESVPSGPNHLVVESKKNPAVDSDGEHVTADSEGLRNREALMKLAGNTLVSRPSSSKQVEEPAAAAAQYQTLATVMSSSSDPNTLIPMVDGNKDAFTAQFSPGGGDRSAKKNRTPPARADHEVKRTHRLDTSQKVGCTDSYLGSLDTIAQQFAKSIRRMAVYS